MSAQTQVDVGGILRRQGFRDCPHDAPQALAGTIVVELLVDDGRIHAGEPQRGIPPCSACHGPGGYKLGAPALEGQHAAYIERQLGEFAQGMRQNDILEQMRVIAKQLTPDEMHAVAAFYGASAGVRGAAGLAMRQNGTLAAFSGFRPRED